MTTMDWHAMWELDKRNIDKGQEAVLGYLGILPWRIVTCFIVYNNSIGISISKANAAFHRPPYASILSPNRYRPDEGRDAVDRLCTACRN